MKVTDVEMQEFIFGGQAKLEFFEDGQELLALFALVAAGAVLEDYLHFGVCQVILIFGIIINNTFSRFAIW
jgi:hypothetical protein